jgi:hypothetical protein
MDPRAVQRFLAVLALIAFWGSPPSTASNAARQSSERPGPIARLNYHHLLSDFDADGQIDQAEPHSAGLHHCIRVRFGNSHERHLELGALSNASGALLTWDINRDTKPDLIWISQSGLERPVAWLGDGRGNFARANDDVDDAALRLLVFGDGADPRLTNSSRDSRVYLTPDQDPIEPSCAATPEKHHKAIAIASCSVCRDLALYLSYLRERGPPCQTSFI